MVWYRQVRTCANALQSLVGYGSAILVHGRPPGPDPVNRKCLSEVRLHHPCWPWQVRCSLWTSSMRLERKRVGFFHVVPNWQKSAWTGKKAGSLRSLLKYGRFQHRLWSGFSKIQGIPDASHSSMILKHARNTALPVMILLASWSDKNLLGIPHGNREDLITFVRSLAREKEVQTGAIMTARTLPFLISCKMRCKVRLPVMSCKGPNLRSQSFALNPIRLHALLTPPAPPKRSITYWPSKPWCLQTCAVGGYHTWFPKGLARRDGSGIEEQLEDCRRSPPTWRFSRIGRYFSGSSTALASELRAAISTSWPGLCLDRSVGSDKEWCPVPRPRPPCWTLFGTRRSWSPKAPPRDDPSWGEWRIGESMGGGMGCRPQCSHRTPLFLTFARTLLGWAARPSSWSHRPPAVPNWTTSSAATPRASHSLRRTRGQTGPSSGSPPVWAGLPLPPKLEGDTPTGSCRAWAFWSPSLHATSWVASWLHTSQSSGSGAGCWPQADPPCRPGVRPGTSRSGNPQSTCPLCRHPPNPSLWECQIGWTPPTPWHSSLRSADQPHSSPAASRCHCPSLDPLDLESGPSPW